MKKYLSRNKLHNKFFKGVKKSYEYVSSTLGPGGSQVIIHNKNSNPISTKDGVSVIKNMILEDPFENMALQIIKESAIKTELSSGDGTTTTIVLAYSIYKNALKYITSGCNVYNLRNGIEKTLEKIIEKIQEYSKPIKSKEEIEKIATMSANGDSIIGKIVVEAIDSIGKDGSIIVENSNSNQTVLNLLEGFQLKSGYISSSFINDERKGLVKYDSPLILVSDYKIDTIDEMMPILEIIARENRPLVIVADKIEGQALAALIYNTIKGTLKIVAINAPKYGEEKRNILKDLSIALGATFISKENNLLLKDTKLQHLGNCKSIEIQKNNSIFIDGKGSFDQIEKRIESLKNEIIQTNDMDICKILQERIVQLTSGVAIIKVGGSSEIEMQEKRFRIDDALEAVKSAQQEGVLPGGGIALIRLIKELNIEFKNEDEQIGCEIIKKSIQEPFRKIIINSNLNPDLILLSLEKENFEMVYDVRTKKIVNMNEGVLDPTKVLRCALQNAISVAIHLITSNYAIVEE